MGKKTAYIRDMSRVPVIKQNMLMYLISDNDWLNVPYFIT